MLKTAAPESSHEKIRALGSCMTREDSENGIDFKDDLGADLEWIYGRIDVHVGYNCGDHLGFVWGSYGVRMGSILKSDSDSGLRPPRDQISRPLGPILALLLDPVLAPCWPHVGTMLEAVGRLQASLVVSGAI